MDALEPEAGRTAFLFFGGKLAPGFVKQIDDARRDLAGTADVHVIAYFEDMSEASEPFRADASFHAYGPERMQAFGYPRKGAAPFRLLPGNTDLPVLAFLQDHPRYDAIWLFEDDAVFTGPVSELVGAFAASSSDLITTNIAPPPVEWPWVGMNHRPEGWPDDVPSLRALLPVYRVSRRLLREVDRFYREGGDGHYEFSWTYVALAAGLEIEDLGGAGDYVRAGNRNRFYTSSPEMLYCFPGSFRFRPAMRRPGRRRSYLWHPVKPQVPTSLADARWRLQLYSRWLRRRLLPGYREYRLPD